MSTMVYDDFTTPQLDSGKWTNFAFPPDDAGDVWVLKEPDAQITSGSGRLDVRIEKFTRFHDVIGTHDNPKNLLVSTEMLPISKEGKTRFKGSMGVTGIGVSPRDYRDAFATIQLIDFAGGWVFDAGASDDMVFSLYERLRLDPSWDTFTAVVEDPNTGIVARSGLTHEYEIIFDPARERVEWLIDGLRVFFVDAAPIPDQVIIGLGAFTFHPIENGKSTSIRGQGISVSYGPISVSTEG